MRVTSERLKARAEQLRKHGIKVRPVLESVTGHQKAREGPAPTRTRNDAQDKTPQEHTRLAS